MDAAIALGAVLLGALLTYVGTLIGEGRASTTEHQKWLRDKRYEMWLDVASIADGRQPGIAPMRLMSGLSMVGTGDVDLAAINLLELLVEDDPTDNDQLIAHLNAIGDARDRFTHLARKELGVHE